MRLRALGLGVRLAILMAFAVFFVAPVLWLILAPTKSDEALITSSPFSFGELPPRLRSPGSTSTRFSNHIYRRWIGNTLFYALSATAITLVDRHPRRLRPRVRQVPRPQAHPLADARRDDHAGGRARAPDLPRAERVHLIGSVLSVILPFSFFPFGVYLAYIYYSTALPPGLLDAARVDGCGELADVPARSRCRSRSRSSRSSSSSASSPTGTTSSCRTSSSRTRTSTRSRSASRTCSPRRRRSTRRSAAAASRSTSSSRSSRSRRCSPSCRWRSSFVFSQRALVRGLVGGAVKE